VWHYKSRSFPTHPSGGFNIPTTFAQHPPPRLQGVRREGKGREGKGKGRGEGKGRDPQGLVDTPYVPNPEKCPAISAFAP